MTKLTIAQAEAIFELLNSGYADEIPFMAHQAFPERNNKHNAMRRTCRTLAKKGLLDSAKVYLDSGELADGYVVNTKAAKTFHNWASARDYDFSCFG